VGGMKRERERDEYREKMVIARRTGGERWIGTGTRRE